jgi:hypothetical protein
MPLEPGKSRAAFSHNVREMIEAGHPQKQALAAAYAEKRRSDGSMSKLDEILHDCSEYDSACGSRADDSKFSEMVGKLERREGYSHKVATETAAKIGREKYGAHEMAKKAAASRKAHG